MALAAMESSVVMALAAMESSVMMAFDGVGM
jgi:hypothetical protein